MGFIVFLFPFLIKDNDTSDIHSCHACAAVPIQLHACNEECSVHILKFVIYTESRGQSISFSVHTRDSNAARRLPVPTVLFSHPSVASQQHLLGKFLSKLRTTKPQRTKTWNCPQPVRSSWSNPRIVPGINPKPLSTSTGCKQPRHAWLTGAACVTWLYEHTNRRVAIRDVMQWLLLQGPWFCSRPVKNTSKACTDLGFPCLKITSKAIKQAEFRLQEHLRIIALSDFSLCERAGQISIFIHSSSQRENIKNHNPQ